MDKLSEINTFLKRHYLDPLHEERYHLIDDIYDIYINGNVNDTDIISTGSSDDDTVLLTIIGKYYYCIRNYSEMEKYFTVAIEKGNSDAMYCMGIYYEDRRNDTMTVKYYTMAIEKGNTDAMCRMGMYNDIYRKRNIDDMIKYFMMAIENGNSKAMCQLGLYYEHVRDYDNMEKYYMMSIDKGYSSAMYFLGNYYERVSSGSGLKYFMMGVEKKCPYCMSEVAIHHERHENYDEMEKYYLLAFEADKTFSTAADSLVKYYHTKKNYECAIKYCLLGVDKNMNHDINYRIMEYLTREHIQTVIKYLIELDIDIRVLTTSGITCDDIYVKLYDITKENIMLKNEVLELQLRPPSSGGLLYEEAKKDFNALCH